ncbi:hypothetical protein [uncultured Aquimarina sp.]|uniref:hypothetical protein n=1 Tax=uncultured Aquimarina sp. TaxID=575652 RepID=UPI00262BB290|nr:hypothetical protein [uncultured Aquimarina sp.]
MKKLLLLFIAMTISSIIYSQENPQILDAVIRDYNPLNTGQCSTRVNASIYLGSKMEEPYRLMLNIKTTDGRTIYSKTLKPSDFKLISGVYDYNTPELDISSFNATKVDMTINTLLQIGFFPIPTGLEEVKRSAFLCN